MSDKKPQNLYVFVKENRSHGYFRLEAIIVTDSREHDPKDRERYPYGTGDHYKGPLYTGLQATCQGDHSSQRSTTRECAVYGFGRLTYGERHSTELAEAERMVKTIKALERKLAKLQEVRGYAQTYPEFIGRFAEVLNAKGIVIERTVQSREMTGERYEWLSVGEGVTRTANTIQRWQREAMPEAMSA